MKGIYHIEVKNRDASFKFDLYRNITIVRGDSGTGKSTLYQMIADYTRLKEASGVNLSCDKECVALTDIDWQNQLMNIKDSIVFIDEGAQCLSTEEFAHTIKDTDNYYVIFNRERLYLLPYSVEEIYEIKTSGKIHSFKKMYKSNAEHVYYRDSARGRLKIDTVVTEDSHSGFQFLQHFFDKNGITCCSSGSNSAIFKWLKEHPEKKTLVIADGAAFGSEIDRILKLSSDFKLCLPESFEWLILKSGVIKKKEINNVLENPSDYIESKVYFTWEQFFEKYLVDITNRTKLKYSKSKINDVYLNEHNSEMIMKEIYSKK